MGKENSHYDCQPVELGFLGAILLGSYEHIWKTRVQYNDLQLFENHYSARLRSYNVGLELMAR